MSAVAPAPALLPLRVLHRLSTLEATRLISRTGAFALDLRQGLERDNRGVLTSERLAAIEIEPAAPLQTAIPRALRCGVVPPGTTDAVTAPIMGEGKTWGRVRMFAEPKLSTDLGLSQFCAYLGQQIGTLLARFEAAAHREILTRKAVLFRQLVARRQAIHRAKALLVHTHRITEMRPFSCCAATPRTRGVDCTSWPTRLSSANVKNGIHTNRCFSQPSGAGAPIWADASAKSFEWALIVCS